MEIPERGRSSVFTSLGEEKPSTEKSDVPAPDKRPAKMVVPKEDADIPGSPNPHWNDDAEAYKMRSGPFLEIPIDKRDTPYSRLYKTEVPPVQYPQQFFPGTQFERPEGKE